MTQRRCNLNIRRKLPIIQHVTDSLCCILPGNNLGSTTVADGSARADVDAVSIIPGTDFAVCAFNTITAVIEVMDEISHFFQGFLLGKLGSQHHTMIGRVAAYPEDVINIVLVNRKSEGCKDRTLRFFNTIDLFCFRRDGHADIQETQL